MALKRSVSGTLTPGVVKTEIVRIDQSMGAAVVNRSMTGTIWIRVDGIDPATSPLDNCFPVMAVRNIQGRSDSIEVRMISTQALDYTVEGSLWPLSDTP